MKIQIASDLHLEFVERCFPGYRVVDATDADVLVMAGDIQRHAMGVQAFDDWNMPVIYVHGNHELYGGLYGQAVDQLRKAARQTPFHFLERDEFVLGNVRFLEMECWIHGHVYDSFDYRVRGTRILANTRGYPLNLDVARSPAELVWENRSFDPGLVIEV